MKAESGPWVVIEPLDTQFEPSCVLFGSNAFVINVEFLLEQGCPFIVSPMRVDKKFKGIIKELKQ